MSTPSVFTPSRLAGLARSEDFAPRAGRAYTRSRNYDFGPDRRDNVSCLSPWLRHRLVLEEEVLAAALAQHGRAGAEKFIDEVFWRAYFKGWLEQRPSVWRDYRQSLNALAESLAQDANLQQRYDDAVAGNTGIDCLDAWSQELTDTGYLHNHARMWFASIWIFTLRLPWQLGADFFLRHLLDGDPASNTLSWRWVGGLHTRGKTYLARASNIRKYTDGRFDPGGLLATEAPSLEEDADHALVEIPESDAWPEDDAWGLLITEEDGCSDQAGIAHAPFAVMGVTCTEDRSPLPIGQRAADFASGAVDDAVARACDQWRLEAAATVTFDDPEALINFATHHKLRTIATAHAPAGPVADRLTRTRDALAAAGITLRQVRREYDTLAWPHARRGFFGLKKKIPKLLGALELD